MLQSTAIADQVLRLEGHLGHVPDHAAACRPRDPDRRWVRRTECCAGESFAGKRVDYKSGCVEAEVVELRDANVGVEDWEERVGVNQQQALAPLDTEHIGVPVIATRIGVNQDAGPVTQQLQQSRGASQQHDQDVTPPIGQHQNNAAAVVAMRSPGAWSLSTIANAHVTIFWVMG